MSEDQLRDAIAAFTRAERELTNLGSQAEALRSASTRLSETETTLKEASASLAGTAGEISSMAEAIAAIARLLKDYVTTLSEMDPKEILARLENVDAGVERLFGLLTERADTLRSQIEELHATLNEATANVIKAAETTHEHLRTMSGHLQDLRSSHEAAVEERRRLQLLLLVVAVLSLIAASTSVAALLL